MKFKGGDNQGLMRQIEETKKGLSDKEHILEEQMRDEYQKQLEDPRLSKDTKQRLREEFKARTGKELELEPSTEERPKAA
jgi:hypothetical protein